MPIVMIILSAVFVIIDQLIKVVVVDHLKPVGTVTLIPNILNLTFVQNPGAAFGMLKNQIWLLVAITVLVSAVIIFLLFAYQDHTFFSYAASVLIIAGGLGNMIDRVYYNYVVDYISFSFFPPVFNFADCCVTIGCVFLIIHIIFFAESRNKREYVTRYRSRR